MKHLSFILLLFTIGLAACKKEKTEAPVILYQNDLSSNDYTWNVEEEGYYNIKFDQGRYNITVDTPDWHIYSVAPYYIINTPYAIQVDAVTELTNTNGLGSTGIVFNRIDNSNYSVAEVAVNGTYRIWTRTDGIISTVINATVNPAIKTSTGASNTIKVIQRVSDMELRINNTPVVTCQIPLASGYCKTGVIALTSYNSYYTKVTGRFNKLIITEP